MSIPILNAEQLRQLTDAAASRRGGDPYWVVYGGQDSPTVHQSSDAPRDAVFGVQTRKVDPQRAPVTEVIVASEHVLTKNLAHKYDAVFWSEAAVEKFVLPYYASKSMWSAAFVLDLISECWYDGIPLPDGLPLPEDLAEMDPVPFAMAHTPDSDWGFIGPEDDPTRLLVSDLHLLLRGPAGEVRVMRLSDVLDLREAAGTAGRARRTPAETAAW